MQPENQKIPVVLVVAGSDSGGGAGIQADIRTLAALGVFGATAITAVTAQNTTGVKSILPLPIEVVVAQVDAIAGDFQLSAVKTGMLPGAACIEAVADAVRRWHLSNLVVDPVMVAKGGTSLMSGEAIRALKEHLFPLVTVLTPNLPEAEALLERPLNNEDAYRQACRDLVQMGPRFVVLKGGHRPGPPLDLLYDGRHFWEFRHPRIDSPHTHGTGCTFASAIAGYLALGRPVPAAVEAAKTFVTTAIRNALAIGHGHGPVWQLGRVDG